GIHTHLSLPPTNILVRIQINLEHIINEATQIFEKVTPKKIMSSNLLKAYFGKDLFTEIHSSLNNLDNTFDDGSLMIICMNKSQVIAWKNIEYFQIDMASKRVRENINEFEINNYCENYNQSITYACVYTNASTFETYYQIFTSLWHYFKILTEESPMFDYIHNKGWRCILGDLDQGQAKGLGLALANIEPKKRKYSNTEKNQYTTRSTANKNKLQKNFETDLDETEKNLAIREKQLELEEHKAELELKRLNIKKIKKDLNL
ncbi:7304_t:CDS:2, partial [Cetraspora pellucida]